MIDRSQNMKSSSRTGRSRKRDSYMVLIIDQIDWTHKCTWPCCGVNEPAIENRYRDPRVLLCSLAQPSFMVVYNNIVKC